MLSQDGFLYLVHHVFLPPQLPQKADSTFGFGFALLDMTIEALGAFRYFFSNSQLPTIDAMMNMLSNMKAVHSRSTDGIVEDELRQSFRNVVEHGGILPLHVRAQNAGIIISNVGTNIHFEAFELAPLNEAVMTTRGRLVRHFPTSATAVELGHAAEVDFQTAIAQTLSLMSEQPVPGLQPKVKKAKQMHDEDRDTTHPGMVCGFFNGFVTAVGAYTNVEVIAKNTREDVHWADARFPWRRSPTWLLLRVSLQLGFLRLAQVNGHANLYKQFMLFFMSHILQRSTRFSLDTDLLYIMTAKLSRRLSKLGPNVDPIIEKCARKVLCQTHELMSTRWLAIQNSETRMIDLSMLSSLDFKHDAQIMDLSGLDDFIKAIHCRHPLTRNSEFHPASHLITYSAHSLPNVTGHDTDRGIATQNLHGFETWVGSNLSGWIERHMDDSSACGQLASLMRRYHSLAIQTYFGNVEGTSVMILVLLELWIACDKIAISTCPLLEDYQPGISGELLQNLLLPFRSQMDRLISVENHLIERSRSCWSSKLLFESTDSRECFAARYFDQSVEHQSLHRRVIDRATEARASKLNELDRVKKEYAQLIRLYNQTSCKYYERTIDYDLGLTEECHSSRCARCEYKDRAGNLSIAVFEWPLPADDTKVKTVIFELSVPEWFVHWRDSTMYLLLDVLGAEYTYTQNARSLHHLSADPHLARSFFSPPHTAYPPRMGLLSENKPHVGTHRRGKVVSTATEQDVCLQSGLNYRYYDSSSNTFSGPLNHTEKVPLSCTYVLPSRSKALQKYIFRPAQFPNGPPPNAVIANQLECPDHMTLHEFKELSSIPLGYNLQWMDIAVQLRQPSVDFKKPETALVFLQCIYQTGPRNGLGDPLRESHLLLGTDEFAVVLLDSLNAALGRIEQNWESSQSLAVLIAIARRLLSLSPSQSTKDACLQYLQRASAISLGWAHLLKHKAHEANVSDRRQFLWRSVEAALICGSAFDVDREHLPAALADWTVASVLLQCCLIVFDGRHFLKATSDSQSLLLHSRHQRLLRDAFHILAADHTALHDAVGKSWSAYRSEAAWQVHDGAGHWVVTRTTATLQDDGLIVHYNLLSGELLVNGLPLDRLPSEYEEQPNYHVLFGKSTVEVMPSNVSGMQFSSKREHHGHEVHFGLTTSQASCSKDLLIQVSSKATGATLELVPDRLFRGHFPDFFVNEFIHWYDCHSGHVEFRPIAEAWNPQCTEKWILSRYNESARNEKNHDESKWKLVLPRNGSLLVSIKSETATVLSNALAPLAQPCQIHCVARSPLTLLDVEIPGLRLAFNLTQGDAMLRCREFRGMIVDPDQALGTLVGFHNKLMLRGERNDDRKILMIEGRNSCRTSRPKPGTESDNGGHHTTVTVDRGTVARWHSFEVDSCLERLIDNGSIHSKLFLAYIHALTSFCLPDPLTRRTGTEQAISILSSAAVRSFDQLSRENTDLLSLIADLTPKRAYYPANERVMQTIRWRSELGFMAQHPRFCQLVTSILSHADRCNIFYPNSEVNLPFLRDVDSFLLKRDCIRSSAWRISGYGAEDYTREYDVTYQSRDCSEKSICRLNNAYKFSSLIYDGRVTLDSTPPSAKHLWDFLCRSPEVMGSNRSLDLSQINYNATLLQDRGIFLARNWPALHRVLSGECAQTVNKYALMIWLSVMACSGTIEEAILETVGLLFNCIKLETILTPGTTSFHVCEGRRVSGALLKTEMQRHLRAIHDSREASLRQLKKETKNQFGRRKLDLFQGNQRLAVDRFASFLARQWPTDHPNTPSPDILDDVSSYVDVGGMMSAARNIFRVCFSNRQLFSYLQIVVKTVSDLEIRPVVVPHQTLQFPNSIPGQTGFIAIADLFRKPAPCLTVPCEPISALSEILKGERSPDRLEAFVAELENGITGSQYETEYVDHLKTSLDSLQRLEQQKPGQVPSYESLHTHLESRQLYARRMYSIITAAINPASRAQTSLTTNLETRQWPRTCPMLLLEQLSRDGWRILPDDWKVCITSYGLALTLVQRAKRMVVASLSGRNSDVVAEIENDGHHNWDPLKHPESLLLEIESNIMIRDIQEEIASEMRSPQSDRNTSMQLNMGEGKSSVIVPMVAAALASGSQLVRVVVGKPQAKQMAQMLTSKLGGMLNRRIYHLPISRSLRLDKTAAETVDRICRECMTNGGILLMQPEHILSFQLMGLERYALGDDSVGLSLMRTQDFFDQYSRDIVDESDENFSVKFELIYTMGTQRPIDMSPDRWSCIHQIMDLAHASAHLVMESLPSSLEIQQTSAGRFPRIRILRSDAVDPLMKSIGQKVCEFGLPGFPITRQPRAVRDAVFAYITKTSVTCEEIGLVENSGPGRFWTENTQPILFLLRGLLAGGVLGFVFGRKRWRVNYGLDTSRTPPTKLAVPYRAKDMPTSRSEFSHPDVVILLSSLCYYYGGLTDEHLFASFGRLLDSDQKDVEYQAWVQGAPNLPSAFRQLEGINLQDRTQCICHVFPTLRFNKRVVDYFLCHIVFPKEMKEFPHKLSASGWDIGKVKRCPTTAFSGTSDSRALLPLDVTYLDLPKQQHTNALVLNYLLQPENSVAFLPSATNSLLSDAERLLSTVANFNPPPRVILDVGAQILEMDNREVARAWLNMHVAESARGVVFFNDNDELTVLDREGFVEPLQTSAFANQLDACLVFLDEAHTRGTDLRLPHNYRAAVTLGANLTKDRLVQGESISHHNEELADASIACMRMRRLGKGQSVVFCVTQEIRTKIQECCSKPHGVELSVSDVLHWSISETFTEVRRTMPLWAVQGLRFIRQEELWRNARVDGETSLSCDQARDFLEDEAQGLEHRYRPKSQTTNSATLSRLEHSRNSRIALIADRCRKLEDLQFHGSTLQEEQERELSPEIQQERQVQRPPAIKPAKHNIHPDMKKFVSEGVITPSSQAYMPAFAALSEIRAAATFDVSQLGRHHGLLVSADFARTVQKAGLSDVSDAYQRSVEWILTCAPRGSNVAKHAIIISPYEAQQLYTRIRRSAAVVMHIYKPRWNIGYRPLDHLNFFTVPALPEPRILRPSLVTQLNLFAGQLYFDSLENYQRTCKFLGLAAMNAESDCIVAADGFIIQDSEKTLGAGSGLRVSPVPFLKEVLRIRKNGEGFGKTHLGRMFDGVLLSQSDMGTL